LPCTQNREHRLYQSNFANFRAAGWSDLWRRRIPDHKSPTASIRADIFFNVNVCGPTSPTTTSSQVQGADTGAPGLDRTAYAAA
jgi:hypothetical protein